MCACIEKNCRIWSYCCSSVYFSLNAIWWKNVVATDTYKISQSLLEIVDLICLQIVKAYLISFQLIVFVLNLIWSRWSFWDKILFIQKLHAMRRNLGRVTKANRFSIPLSFELLSWLFVNISFPFFYLRIIGLIAMLHNVSQLRA